MVQSSSQNYNAYIDTSVLLRLAFGEPNPIEQLDQTIGIVSSELLKLECLRAIDRMKKNFSIPDEEVAQRNEKIFYLLKKIELIPVSSRVLDEASQSFPIVLGSLDSIHLASALLWQKSEAKQLVMLTHDKTLGRAARSVGMQVLGCAED